MDDNFNFNLAGYDPFDEPLDSIFDENEELVLDDVYFEAAKNSVTLDGMTYSYLKPPYMNFGDQSNAKRKMMEAYNQREFLLLYGYSGSGKSTLQMQFADRYPDFIKRIENFDELAPLDLNRKIGELIGIDLIHKGSQIDKLTTFFNNHLGYMLVFDNVSFARGSTFIKMDTLRKLNEKGHIPIIISGVNKLYNDLYSDKNLPSTCSIVSRLDEYELQGMGRVDAAKYLIMVSDVENAKFSYPAQQALIATALNKLVGGINALVTVLGRCVTMARAKYYNSDGRTLPDKTECVRPAVPNGKEYPGAELILTLPVTPDPVLIDEFLVAKMQSEYKSHFPTLEKKAEEEETGKDKKKRR